MMLTATNSNLSPAKRTREEDQDAGGALKKPSLARLGKKELDERAINRFSEFLRIPTVSGEGPKGAYQEACKWLVDIAKELELPHEVVEFVPGKPIVLMKWEGSEPHLPSIILNSHYDVVPVMEEHWTMKPFGGEVTEDGKIYGRGAQDMKCVCIQYLEAIQRMRAANKRFRRTIHLTFVPDEEIGGADGMGKLLPSEVFKRLEPVAMALDEGLANPSEKFSVFFGERQPWWVLVSAEGPTGHGSRFIKDTAVSKLLAFATSASAFREEQEARLGHSGPGCKHAQAHELGDVTTVNITMLRAGVSCDGEKTFPLNVIPTSAKAGMDVRIPLTMPCEDMRALLDEWAAKAGEGVSWSYAPWTAPQQSHYATSTSSDQSEWWKVFEGATEKLGMSLSTAVFPAATDSRFLREMGIPALGFSPMNRSPVLLHEHDEYLDSAVFLRGVELYEGIIEALADTPEMRGEASGGGAGTKEQQEEGQKQQGEGVKRPMQHGALEGEAATNLARKGLDL